MGLYGDFKRSLRGRSQIERDKELLQVKKKAESGDAKSQFIVGCLYYHGDYVVKDDAISLKWFEKAARKGEAIAQTALGAMYEFGAGVEQDDFKASEWYQMAARQGEPNALFNLGTMHGDQDCSLYDSEHSEEYFLRAKEEYLKGASLGDADHQVRMGENCFEGFGCIQDFQEAYTWFLKSADQGEVDAQVYLWFMHENGIGMEVDAESAEKWWSEIGDHEGDGALYNIARVILEGKVFKAGKYDQIRLFHESAKRGNMYAQNWLGFCHREGDGVDQDYEESEKWYRKAAEQGCADSQTNLGFMYYEGNGVEQDYTMAAEWWRKAAQKGEVTAQHDLGHMYFEGLGVERDYVKASWWYLKAAEQGGVDDQAMIAWMYEVGKLTEDSRGIDGVLDDDVTAYAWNKIAAESDNETAKGNLQHMLSMMSSEQITRGENLYAKLTKQVELKKESKRGGEYNLKSDAKIIEAALVKDSSKEFSELTQEDLEKLTFLRIDEPIKDVSSVARFTQLDRPVIVNGQISDATPLAKLENLEWISFENNQNLDLSPLVDLNQLNHLSLTVKPELDLNIVAELKQLKELWLDRNQLTNVSALVKLVNLEELYLGYNQLTDISALAELKQLRCLRLSHNNLTDVSPLEGLMQLETLGLAENKLTNVNALSGLLQLEELNLEDNELTDVSALAGLENLRTLSLVKNPGLSSGQLEEIHAALPKCEIFSFDAHTASKEDWEKVEKTLLALEGRECIFEEKGNWLVRVTNVEQGWAAFTLEPLPAEANYWYGYASFESEFDVSCGFEFLNLSSTTVYSQVQGASWSLIYQPDLVEAFKASDRNAED